MPADEPECDDPARALLVMFAVPTWGEAPEVVYAPLTDGEALDLAIRAHLAGATYVKDLPLLPYPR